MAPTRNRRRWTTATLVGALALSLVTTFAPGSPAAAPAAAAETFGADLYRPVSPNGYVRQPYGVPQQPSDDDLPPVVDDPGEPFDYYRTPRQVVGVHGGPEEAWITLDSGVRNAFGTLTIDTGVDPSPATQRVRTWRDGWLPILETEFVRDGVRNEIEHFATKLDGVATVPYRYWYGSPRQELRTEAANMVTFAKVTLTNTTDTATGYTVRTGLDRTTVIRGGQNPPTPNNTGPARPAEASWDPASSAVVGDGKLLYTASAQPTAADGQTLTYRFDLAPGETRSVHFAIPYFVGQAADAAAINAADYDTEIRRTVDFWTDLLDSATTRIDVPAAEDLDKVMDTYRASIVLSLIDLDVAEGHYFWDANPTRYDNYWLRDTAFNADGMLDAGFTDLARDVLLMMRLYQLPSGQFESQPGQWDGNGQVLYAWGNYLERTSDVEFARAVWPAVQRSMAWEWQFRRDAWDEANGLLPYGKMTDNERVIGHLVGYNLAAIAGNRGAARVARLVGEEDTAREWERRADEFEDILRAELADTVAELGWVPPAVEGMDAPMNSVGWYGDVYGHDWGNQELVWPSAVFDAHEPWVDSSIQAWRERMREGLFTYPTDGTESTLHSYTPISLTQTYIRRGDAAETVLDLYNLLVHTSATHTATEGISSAERWDWGRTSETQPHGEFAGKYLAMMRDMLAVEYRGELHLANALAPTWTRPGESVSLETVTDWGPLSYRMDFTDGGATATLDLPDGPSQVTLGLPLGMAAGQVTVDGRTIQASGDGPVKLGALSGRHVVEIRFRDLDDRAGPLVRNARMASFPRAVADYLGNYAKMNQPVRLSLGRSKLLDDSPVTVGDTTVVRTELFNTGGAGWLDASEKPVLYVDGQRTDYQFPEVSRGVGFDTPDDVVMFDRLDQGHIALDYTASFCEPGRHTVAVGLGDAPPGKPVNIEVVAPTGDVPAPDVAVTVGGVRPMYPGESRDVTVTVTNPSCFALSELSLDADVADGWSAGSVTGGTVPARGTAEFTLPVTAPDTLDAAFDRVDVPVTATYRWAGGGDRTASKQQTTTAVALSGATDPYRSAASISDAWFGVDESRIAIWAGGRDMWKGPDEYGAVYTDDGVAGATTVTARVREQGNTWGFAKAGVVMRTDLGNNRSTGYVILAITPDNGVRLQWDSDGNGRLDSQLADTTARGYPISLRLVRDGTQVTGEFSVDGTTWQRVGTATVPHLADGADAGVFATATNVNVPGAISGVVFDGFAVTH